MEWTQFIEKFSFLIGNSFIEGLNFKWENEHICHSVNGKEYIFTKNEYEDIISTLSMFDNNTTWISNPKKLETFIEIPDPRFIRHMGYRDLSNYEIKDDNIKYVIGSPSPYLIISFLKAINNENIRKYKKPIPLRMMIDRLNKEEHLTIFDLFSKIMKTTLSLTVETSTDKHSDILFKYGNSFLFTLSYNLDIVLKVVSDSSYPNRDFMRRRINKPDEIMIPRLLYKQALTDKYNMALSSEDPFIQFIAYYHIMENFFEEVYTEAIINGIGEIINNPGFSTKKSKDISKIIDIVKNKVKNDKTEYQGSEVEALKLTIKTFVSLENLRDDLSDYDSSLINYYKQNDVSFSKGDAIDLSNCINEKLPGKIAARIYKTRNSLVHSKSNDSRTKERGVYHSFENNNELLKEIPLMRLIAESIIIKSADKI
jgi:hypothetical protein